jgi:hypothetical protein
MNKSQKNNNPGNLRFAGQKEATGLDDSGFALFPNAPAGWRAIHAQIKLDQGRALTLEKFINKYAPPNENDSGAYLAFVCGELRIVSSTLLSDISPFALAGVMAKMEGYYNKE